MEGGRGRLWKVVDCGCQRLYKVMEGSRGSLWKVMEGCGRYEWLLKVVVEGHGRSWKAVVDGGGTL